MCSCQAATTLKALATSSQIRAEVISTVSGARREASMTEASLEDAKAQSLFCFGLWESVAIGGCWNRMVGAPLLTNDAYVKGAPYLREIYFLALSSLIVMLMASAIGMRTTPVGWSTQP